MRGAPQVGFSATIRKIKARTSLLTRFRRPTWLILETHVQYKRNPARCQFTTVLELPKTRGCLHLDQHILNATQNSLCRAVNRRRGRCACSASNCRRRAKFSRTRSARQLKELTNQPRKCRSDKIMAKNFSGKDRIELCAKSLISLVYDPLARHKAKAKGECPNTKAAVFIDGKGAGSIFYLCQTEKCEVHNRVTGYQPTPQEQSQRKKEALAERVERLSRVRVLEAIRKKLLDVLSRPDLEMVALDYFRRLGHDNHRRLSKLYAWEEKKSKTSWGAETVDHEKIAATAVQAMKTADLHRFLLVCALVSDLYCPGYNPRQSLEKSSNLARTAVRYKIDTAKVAVTVRADLAKKKEKQAGATESKRSSSGASSQRKSSKAKPTNQG